MYELYKLNEDLYQIHSSFYGDEAKEGTLLAIITYATYTLGFNVGELEYALLDMLKNDYDGAHFGTNRTFLFSFDRSSKRKMA